MNTIIGVFDDATAARRALEALRDSPLALDDVSIVSRATASGEAVANDDDVSAGEGAAVGAVWGGLVGLAALLIPGVGPFIAGGALFAALTGAVTGAVVGGISAALIDFGGIPEHEARGYETMVHEGKTLVAVKARDEDAAEVRRMLDSFGAESVRGEQAAAVGASGSPVHVAMYDESGRRVDQDAAYASVGAAADQDVAYSSVGTASQPRGIYNTPASRAIDDTPEASTRDPYATREIPASGQPNAEQTWTSGEDVGAGQGAGQRKDTGVYDAKQWVGEGQGPGGHREGEQKTWTSGEVVGEGQGQGQRKDTGTYDAKQWVGEGQGDDITDDDTTKRRP
jgi:uncharacterized membrane protein